MQRVRPKLMTVATMLIGLTPLLWATGSGADVMKRIAAPMVGGLRRDQIPINCVPLRLNLLFHKSRAISFNFLCFLRRQVERVGISFDGCMR